MGVFGGSCFDVMIVGDLLGWLHSIGEAQLALSDDLFR